MTQADWDDPDRKTLVAEMRMASGSPEYVERKGALLIVLNTGPAVEVKLSDPPEGTHWVRRFDTAEPAAWGLFEGTLVDDDSVVVFVQEPLNSEEEGGET